MDIKTISSRDALRQQGAHQFQETGFRLAQNQLVLILKQMPGSLNSQRKLK